MIEDYFGESGAGPRVDVDAGAAGTGGIGDEDDAGYDPEVAGSGGYAGGEAGAGGSEAGTGGSEAGSGGSAGAAGDTAGTGGSDAGTGGSDAGTGGTAGGDAPITGYTTSLYIKTEQRSCSVEIDNDLADDIGDLLNTDEAGCYVPTYEQGAKGCIVDTTKMDSLLNFREAVKAYMQMGTIADGCLEQAVMVDFPVTEIGIKMTPLYD
jgi:hypothetical protein